MYTNDLLNCSSGVLIYVRNTLKSEQLYYEKPPQEVVTVEVEGQKDTLKSLVIDTQIDYIGILRATNVVLRNSSTISNIYRSPNSSEDNNKNLNSFIDNLATKTSW
jgi:hypothetical protein